jgi:Tfp pilus assembly protein PilO
MQIDRPIAIALTLFAILILAFFFVSPQYQRFKSLQLDLGLKRAEFNAKYDYFSEITKTYYDIEARKDEVKKIDDALPVESNLGRLIYFLQKKTVESGIIIKSLFLSKASLSGEEGGVNEIVFSLNSMGSYSALGNFLASLEKSDRLFEVTNISFSSGAAETSGAEQIYSFSLEIKTHTY